MKYLFTAFIILIFFLVSTPVFAANEPIINEFLPTPSSGNSEWVEFYNPTDKAIDLSNYWFDDDNTLLSEGIIQKGTADPGSDPKNILGTISAKSLFVLELSSYLNNDGDFPSLFLLLMGRKL